METKEGSGKEGEETNFRSVNAHNSSTISRTVSFAATGRATDIEEHSEYDGTIALNTSPDGNIEDVVGFSIGQEQLRMKSLDTPAFEKAKALNQSKDYFDLEPEDEDLHEGGASPEAYQDYEENTGGAQLDVLAEVEPECAAHQFPPSKASPEDASRSGISRSILKDGLGPRLRRASSDSISMVGTLKKLLPDISSMSFPKAPGMPTFGFGSKARGESQLPRSKRSSTLFSRGNLPWLPSGQSPDRSIITNNTAESLFGEDSTSAASLAGNNHVGGVEGSDRTVVPDFYESSPLSAWSTHNRRLLRRAISENSLFIRNDLERTTTQDDAEKWANVSEQINSRFKAITDSFQDSAISRLPRMPNVSFGSFRPGVRRSGSDIARQNGSHVATAQGDVASKEISALNGVASHPPKQSKHAHPVLNQAVSSLRGDVVVLGGYRGSILRSAKPPNKQLWVPVKVRNVLENLTNPRSRCLTNLRIPRLA